MKNIPHLVTFPRSGSHYLDKIIYKEAKISIDKSHSINKVFDKDGNKQKTIITIVRDPLDAISSYLALQEKESGHTNSKRIEETITNYVFMHSFLYNHADCIIDFKDLVNRPDDVVKKVFSLLEIKNTDYKLFERTPNLWWEEYTPSSKILPEYKKYNLNEENFGLCYSYYNKILERKIVI